MKLKPNFLENKHIVIARSGSVGESAIYKSENMIK